VLTLIVPWAILVVLCEVWVRTERLPWGRGESQEASIVHVDITRMCKLTFYISIAKPTRCTSFSNLFHFIVALYMFRTVFPSIIRSLRLYIQHQVYVKQILLFAC